MKKEAFLYDSLGEGLVKCGLCPHRCVIAPDAYGICRVRQNISGRLYTLVYAETVASNMDPIEKKPLFHFLPGTFSYSIAAMGCNFRCGFCQNWQISQLDSAYKSLPGMSEFMPGEVALEAVTRGAKSISYTYTEPTVFFEYAMDVSKEAHARGLKNVFVTNGYMTPAALDTASDFLDAANIDLKSFDDDFYKTQCGGSLKPVLDTIIKMKECGIWVEITTLIVPGLNDSDEELSAIAGFISSVDSQMPWHISRFFGQYEFEGRPPTPVSTMKKAMDIGFDAGLSYIYPGNLSGRVDTICPGCSKPVLVRNIYRLESNTVKNGRCSACSTPIEGVWQ